MKSTLLWVNINPNGPLNYHYFGITLHVFSQFRLENKNNNAKGTYKIDIYLQFSLFRWDIFHTTRTTAGSTFNKRIQQNKNNQDFRGLTFMPQLMMLIPLLTLL